MNYMFYQCENLISLNLSSFNTKNVEDMSYLFSHCQNLDYLNLSSFDTDKVNKIEGIFFRCKKNIIESNKSKFNKFNEDDMY